METTRSRGSRRTVEKQPKGISAGTSSPVSSFSSRRAAAPAVSFIHESSGECPHSLAGVVLAFDEQQLQLFAVIAENHTVGCDGRVRVLVGVAHVVLFMDDSAKLIKILICPAAVRKKIRTPVIFRMAETLYQC